MNQVQAMQVKQLVRTRLGRPDWLRGIGIGCDGQEFYVKVNVVEMTPHVQSILQHHLAGLDVRIATVGDITFQPD